MAVGDEKLGLQLFTKSLSATEAIIVGFGLEMGLREFYLALQKRTAKKETEILFGKLAEVEVLHQEQLLALYKEITGSMQTRDDFTEKVVSPAMEGGMTTEEYLGLYNTDLDDELEVLSLALAIEAQALDLYLRAAGQAQDQESRKVLHRIAEEERHHIARLGDYIEHRGALV